MNQPFAVWAVTNAVQSSVYDGKELPLGGVQLDSFQEDIARSSPPLIIESRSGTGKTLALLQHAANHCDLTDKRAACFITVSPRLRRQLHQKYDELNTAANLQLPATSFYSFNDLIARLVKYAGAGSTFEGSDKCHFLAFSETQTSHKANSMDPHLVENEIGGVISGSIDAALQGTPLNRVQYLATKRSNIENKSEAGQAERSPVFDECERCAAWKKANSKFDMNDVVLRLLQEEWPVTFSAGKNSFAMA